MYTRQVRLARGISQFLSEHEGFELLAQGPPGNVAFENTHIIVMFRAKDDKTNGELVNRINRTRKMYVSGTKWSGKPACRIAISTWKVKVDRDLQLITEVLESTSKVDS